MPPSQLSIKTNAHKRLRKELELYSKEVTDQEAHVANLKSLNTDPYEVKKQVEVLDESKRMVAQLEKKVVQSKEALSKFLESYNGEEDATEAKSLVL